MNAVATIQAHKRLVLNQPPRTDGWLWRPKVGTGPWMFRAVLEGRSFPDGAEFMPVRFLFPEGVTTESAR